MTLVLQLGHGTMNPHVRKSLRQSLVLLFLFTTIDIITTTMTLIILIVMTTITLITVPL